MRDSRSAWDSNVLNDPRATELCDGNRIADRWLADHQLGGLGGSGSIVWDAYYAFPPSLRESVGARRAITRR